MVHFLIYIAGRSEDAIGVRWSAIENITDHGAIVNIAPGKTVGGK